jgi:N-acetylglucosaminyldiphosphoundecaprenol N-acetyl-beta-D-mannosaminyltransferase
MKKTDETVLLFDLNVFSKQKSLLLRNLQNKLLVGKSLTVVYTPNPEQIIQSRGDEVFRQALKSADLLLPDGVGLVVASRFLALLGQTKPIAERITGVEVAAGLLDFAQKKDFKVLVIGGKNYSPSNYFAYQGAKVDWTPGFVDVSQPTAREKSALEKKITAIKPDIVFVAFGAPAQEVWIENNRQLLQKNKVKIAMAVGGSFDFLLGQVPRAPYLMRKLGLEWLFRLLIEPWRIKRQLRLISFIFLVVKTAFTHQKSK